MAVSLTLQRLAWMLVECPRDWWGGQCAGVRGPPGATLASPLAGCVALRGPFAGPQALLTHLAHWPSCESLPHSQGPRHVSVSFICLFGCVGLRCRAERGIFAAAHGVFAAVRGVFAAARGLSSCHARGLRCGARGLRCGARAQ